VGGTQGGTLVEFQFRTRVVLLGVALLALGTSVARAERPTVDELRVGAAFVIQKLEEEGAAPRAEPYAFGSSRVGVLNHEREGLPAAALTLAAHGADVLVLWPPAEPVRDPPTRRARAMFRARLAHAATKLPVIVPQALAGARDEVIGQEVEEAELPPGALEDFMSSPSPLSESVAFQDLQGTMGSSIGGAGYSSMNGAGVSGGGLNAGFGLGRSGVSAGGSGMGGYGSGPGGIGLDLPSLDRSSSFMAPPPMPRLSPPSPVVSPLGRHVPDAPDGYDPTDPEGGAGTAGREVDVN
jgi:hypothetical protein